MFCLFTLVFRKNNETTEDERMKSSPSKTCSLFMQQSVLSQILGQKRFMAFMVMSKTWCRKVCNKILYKTYVYIFTRDHLNLTANIKWYGNAIPSAPSFYSHCKMRWSRRRMYEYGECEAGGISMLACTRYVKEIY